MSLQQPQQRSFVNCPDHHLLATDILLSPTIPVESCSLRSEKSAVSVSLHRHVLLY
jgi:hypothetical protein